MSAVSLVSFINRNNNDIVFSIIAVAVNIDVPVVGLMNFIYVHYFFFIA